MGLVCKRAGRCSTRLRVATMGAGLGLTSAHGCGKSMRRGSGAYWREGCKAGSRRLHPTEMAGSMRRMRTWRLGWRIESGRREWVRVAIGMAGGRRLTGLGKRSTRGEAWRYRKTGKRSDGPTGAEAWMMGWKGAMGWLSVLGGRECLSSWWPRSLEGRKKVWCSSGGSTGSGIIATIKLGWRRARGGRMGGFLCVWCGY